MSTDSKNLPKAPLKAAELGTRLRDNRGVPCFIVAPPQCGQQTFIQELCKEEWSESAVMPCEVSAEGRCIVAGEGCPDPEKSIVLIAELPWLEDEAAERFSDELDMLVELGHLVIVLCSAQNDRYHNLQSDRIVIFARELKEAGFLTPQAYGQSLASFLEEFLPLQIRLAAALAACLREATLPELLSLGYEFSSDIPGVLASLSPLFTTDQTGAILYAEEVEPRHFAASLVQVLVESIKDQGAQADIALIAARVTALSMHLLERGNLESSHQLLEIAESVISTGVRKRQGAEGQSDALELLTRGLLQGNEGREGGSSWTQNAPVYLHGQQATTGGIVVVKEPAPLVAPLYLNLFGRFRAVINGKALSNQHLSRAKVRRLMAYLALNQQRVVPRDTLVDYLWPHLDQTRAQNNLYTSWCMLSKGLQSESSKECPYLERNGELYQINPEHVVCDTHQFEQIARMVLLGRSDTATHIANLAEMEALYRSSLTADLTTDAFIKTKMEMYRSLMVDSLLVVTRQLRVEGELEKSLYYARAAYDLDETREDVYRELMDTQGIAGQRTSAMQTYFSCKQYLSEELGILPSRSTTALYQELLLDNCR